MKKSCARCKTEILPWQKAYEVTVWLGGGFGHSDGKPYCKPCALILCERWG